MTSNQAGASAPYTGGCACGEIRYEVTGEPAAMFHCQCRQCHQGGSNGHASHIAFVDADVSLTGTAREWGMTGEQGTRKNRGFCGTCGSPVLMTFPDKPAMLVISPASLDDPERFAPQMLTWTDAGFSWDHVDPSLPRFAKLPPDTL